MKKLIIALVCAAALSSCGKKDEPKPVTPAAQKGGFINPDKQRHY